jgi:hypothetical protein
MDLVLTFRDEIKLILSFVTIPLITFLISLANVYLWGRMLDLVHSPRVKNLIAFFTLIACYFYYFSQVATFQTLEQRFWQAIIYVSLSILFYVLLGFQFYERVEMFIDKVTKTNVSNKKKRGSKK